MHGSRDMFPSFQHQCSSVPVCCASFRAMNCAENEDASSAGAQVFLRVDDSKRDIRQGNICPLFRHTSNPKTFRDSSSRVVGRCTDRSVSSRAYDEYTTFPSISPHNVHVTMCQEKHLALLLVQPGLVALLIMFRCIDVRGVANGQHGVVPLSVGRASSCPPPR